MPGGRKTLAHQLRDVAGGSRSLSGRPLERRPRLWMTGDALQVAPTPLADGPARLARVEAVLFVSREAVSLKRLAQLANLTDATEARTLVEQLSRNYTRRNRAFQIENVAGGYRLLTRPQFAPWVGKIGDFCDLADQQFKLTPPALDTLTVVAYRQPVLRSEVEAIRGVACGELLRQLIERDLLRIVGRSEELGRPLEYGTTKRFLQMFGLKSLNDLPPLDEPVGPTLQLASESNPQQNVVPRAA
jgi:segregation and condensation protein B